MMINAYQSVTIKEKNDQEKLKNINEMMMREDQKSIVYMHKNMNMNNIDLYISTCESSFLIRSQLANNRNPFLLPGSI